MTNIDAQAVASLRKRTGVSMMECKKALEEAGGNEEKAIEILRSRGMSAAAKKADRDQGEGMIFAATTDGKGAMVIVHCETDFVARDDGFQTLGQELADTALNDGEDAVKALAEEKMPEAVQKLGENISLGEVAVIAEPVVGAYVHTNGKVGVLIGMTQGDSEQARDAAMHAAAMSPSYKHPDEVSADIVEKEKVIWTEQLSSEGKPAEILEKIMTGKEKKFREEVSLLTQAFVKDPEKTVAQHLGHSEVTEYVRFAIGG